MNVIDNKIYKINSDKTEIELYSNKYVVKPKMLEGRNVIQFVSNSKIYVADNPNISNPNSKSIFHLRQVFSNALFIQGKVTNISIVDINGNIFENLKTQIQKFLM